MEARSNFPSGFLVSGQAQPSSEEPSEPWEILEIEDIFDFTAEESISGKDEALTKNAPAKAPQQSAVSFLEEYANFSPEATEAPPEEIAHLEWMAAFVEESLDSHHCRVPRKPSSHPRLMPNPENPDEFPNDDESIPSSENPSQNPDVRSTPRSENPSQNPDYQSTPKSENPSQEPNDQSTPSSENPSQHPREQSPTVPRSDNPGQNPNGQATPSSESPSSAHNGLSTPSSGNASQSPIDQSSPNSENTQTNRDYLSTSDSTSSRGVGPSGRNACLPSLTTRKIQRSGESDEGRKCTHCDTEKTPQWRAGPLGPKSLCNACGVRYKSGRLFPEYRPAASPTFSSSQHSNSHRKVLELQRLKEKEPQQQQLHQPQQHQQLQHQQQQQQEQQQLQQQLHQQLQQHHQQQQPQGHEQFIQHQHQQHLLLQPYYPPIFGPNHPIFRFPPK